MSLKRKKAYEKQIEQIDNSISRVNEQQMMLENQRTTAETVLALQQGVRANKATMQARKDAKLMLYLLSLASSFLIIHMLASEVLRP